MDNFIHRENLALFKRRLAETTDERARQMLQKLMAEEEAKAKDAPPTPKS